MNISNFYQKQMNINPKVIELIKKGEEEIFEQLKKIDTMAEYHQSRILMYMKECRISERHFVPSTGYGYSDESRDKLDELFALVFGGEDALVRPQWVSGTHVISDALFALLRPGDVLLSITGKPYDTLEGVIGIGEEKTPSSLKEWGISYKQVDLINGKEFDIPRIMDTIAEGKVKAVFIQRSRGYEWRDSLSIDKIKQVIDTIKKQYPEIFIIVDNCYGEFTEEKEPSHVGADLVLGSLIKNPGGGLAPTGAYAVGTREAVELMSYRLTSPAIGREVGSYEASYRPFYQGFFIAPHIVAESIKGAVLAAWIFKNLGYEVKPQWHEKHSDIIQSIRFNTAEELIAFCQAIQTASPVDGHVVPYPWDMPGYSHQVIMAAGTFVQGASIELSADAPIKEPYIAYLQGGLTYAHVKLALMTVVNKFYDQGYIKI